MSLREILFFIVTPFFVVKCLSSAIFGLGFFTGLIFLNPASLFWGLEKYRIPLLFSVVLLVSAIKSKSFDRPLFYSVQHILIGFFFTLLVLSAFNSFWPARSFIEIRNWYKLFIYFFLFSHICKSVDDINTMNSVIVAAMVVLSLRGMYRYAAGYPWIQGLPHSYIADRNDFALALAMTLPLIDSLTGYYSAGLKTIIKYLPIFIIATIILTYSRMGFILILFYLMCRFFSTKRKALYLFVAFFAILIGSSFVPAEYVERIKGISNYEQDASSMGRIVAWYAGFEMMKDNPLTGVGLNCFELPGVYRKYDQTFPPHVAHNTYVQLGAESGPPALFIFLLLIISCILKLFSLNSKTKGMQVNDVIRSLIISFAIYLVGSVFISVENREMLYIIIAETVTLGYLYCNNVDVKSSCG